ncbi:MAG: outer membrane lipoprotein-sorting protein [Spirochaetes bacterium]|nr:outer membrane lipoprotein-sorting protein [Spirochaetota bacterium]
MKNLSKGAIILATLALFAAASAVAEPTGAEIMLAVYVRPQGNDMSGVLTMTLVDARGKERVRSLKQISGSYGSVDKKLMTFQSPADVRGTSFMNWSYAETGKGDDQWIYLPALKRVKRISSEGRSDYFMGSDFTYDDLGDRQPSEDIHKLTGSETVDGEACWVVESVPKDPKDIYSRTVTWVSKAKNLGLKREYFDRRGALLKTLRISSSESVAGVWVIMKAEMHDVQKDHRTRMEFSDVRINAGIAEGEFSERAMTR